MSRRFTLVIVLLLFAVISAVAQERHDPKQDFNATMKKYRAAQTEEEKISLWLGFLERNPDTEYTVGTVNYLLNVRYMRNDDPEGAIRFIEDTLAKITDTDRRRQVKLLSVRVYGKAGMRDKLVALADEIAGGGGLGFNDHAAFASAGVEAGAWQLALDHAEAALKLATPEAVKAEFEKAGRKIDDARAERTSRRRTGSNMAIKGWALVNLGRTEEGLATFAEAVDKTPYHYVGVPNSQLDVYWAETLIRAGDYKAALDKIAPDAIMLGSDEAKALFKKAYVALNGSEAGLDEFTWKKRLEIARSVDDFTLPGYDGKRHSLSELRGKVTLLAFWFPT